MLIAGQVQRRACRPAATIEAEGGMTLVSYFPVLTRKATQMLTHKDIAFPLDDTREFRRREREEALVNVHDATLSLSVADATVREWNKHDTDDTSVQPNRAHRQLTLPPWPTSKSGSRATSPPPGQKPVPGRTDQMVYECYDEERGRPCVVLPGHTRRESEKLIEQARSPGPLEQMSYAETLQATSIAPQEEQFIHQHPLGDQVVLGQQVYDTHGWRLGKVTVRFPRYILVERGLLFHRAYYIPLTLVQRVEGQCVWLMVSEAILKERGFTVVPADLYDAAQSPGVDDIIDISDASRLGKYPLTPAEMGHYHYGPRGPGMNTDAGGSYAPYEIDPYGRPVDRPVKLYTTGERLRRRTL